MKHYLVFLLVVLSACASPPMVKSSEPGLLVTDLHSNANNIKLSLISQDGKNSSAIFEVMEDDNFRVLSLPPGHYTWHEINHGQYSRNIQGEYSFKIDQGKINYVGDILLKVNNSGQVNIHFINKSTAIRERLEEEFFPLFSQYPYVENITQKTDDDH